MHKEKFMVGVKITLIKSVQKILLHIHYQDKLI